MQQHGIPHQSVLVLRFCFEVAAVIPYVINMITSSYGSYKNGAFKVISKLRFCVFGCYILITET